MKLRVINFVQFNPDKPDEIDNFYQIKSTLLFSM